MEKSNTYLANKQNAEQGKAVFKALEEETKRPMEEQQNLLFKILKDNQNTEFGKAHGFSEIRSIEDYQKKVAVVFFRYIADNYKMLIDDIESGTISADVDLPDETRESLLKKIKPLPERGQELREIFKDGSDFKWVKKVWPKFLYMVGIGGDGFQIYDRMIKNALLKAK